MKMVTGRIWTSWSRSRIQKTLKKRRKDTQGNKLSHRLKVLFFFYFFQVTHRSFHNLKLTRPENETPCITPVLHDTALLEHKGTFSCFYVIPHLGSSHLCPKAPLLTRLHAFWDITCIFRYPNLTFQPAVSLPMHLILFHFHPYFRSSKAHTSHQLDTGKFLYFKRKAVRRYKFT